MKNKIKFLLEKIQIIILYISYFYYKIFVNKTKKVSWVIGVDEIASMLFFVGSTLKNSTTVCLRANHFYDLEYDYSIKIKNKYLRFFIRIIYGPILLGYLANKNTHFYYIWCTGFLLKREDEFRFLKANGKKIVLQFNGDDIRSLVLTKEHANSLSADIYANYYGLQDASTSKTEYDQNKQYIAQVADKYADLIFNFPIDQMSYIKSKQFAPTFMFDKNKFYKNDNKFLNIDKTKILHAPSNAINKGTQLVRAAIKKLQLEGYKFEYVELQHMPNEVVLEHLRSSHIVLNQFYAFTGGVFGIESMANHCAVLMSADPSIETGLPQDSKDAWMVTKYWEVYDNLKYLLDNPEKIKYYADKGYEFTYKHYTYEAASKYINTVLKENGVI